jgi:hypothetical protein
MALPSEFYDNVARNMYLQERIAFSLHPGLVLNPRNRAVRRSLVLWMLDISHDLDVSADARYRGVQLAQKVMLLHKHVADELALMAAACIWMASKMEDTTPVTVESLTHISGDAFTAASLVEMERVVLRELDYELQNPTPLFFLENFWRQLVDLPQYEEMRLQSLVLLESAITDSYSLLFLPSELAAASVNLTLKIHGRAHKCPQTPNPHRVEQAEQNCVIRAYQALNHSSMVARESCIDVPLLGLLGARDFFSDFREYILRQNAKDATLPESSEEGPEAAAAAAAGGSGGSAAGTEAASEHHEETHATTGGDTSTGAPRAASGDAAEGGSL